MIDRASVVTLVNTLVFATASASFVWWLWQNSESEHPDTSQSEASASESVVCDCDEWESESEHLDSSQSDQSLATGSESTVVCECEEEREWEAGMKMAIRLSLEEANFYRDMQYAKELQLQEEEQGVIKASWVEFRVNQDMAYARKLCLEEVLAKKTGTPECSSEDSCLPNQLLEERAVRTNEFCEQEFIDLRIALEMQGHEAATLMDSAVASSLQQELDIQNELAEKHEKAMSESPLGSSVHLAREMQLIHQSIASKDVEPIGKDDMVFVANRFFSKLSEFKTEGKPARVDLGYHYTRASNLESIRTHGLLSREERSQYFIETNYNGSIYGDGIYSAKGPEAFKSRYGDTGVIVARLPGVVEPCSLASTEADTVLVHSGTIREFTVMKNCGQCLPLFKFRAGTDASILSLYHDQALSYVAGAVTHVK